MIGNDIIYVPYGDPRVANDMDIVKWGNCEILNIQQIKDTNFGKYKVMYDDSPFGYFVIGCKGTGLKIDNVKYMADDNGLIDIKTINTYLHNREITETLEKI